MEEGSGADLQTRRTRLRRFPKRGSYDRESVHRVLDAGLVCHLGFVAEGQPFVIPTAYARIGECVYVHGSAASRALRALRGGAPVCITVTLVDGLVLARTAFNHSFNYRSVVVLGVAEEVAEPAEKERALRAFTERLVPGRWDDVKPPTKEEMAATSVLALPIREASVKERAGPPGDAGDELLFRTWAGVIPFELCAGPPIPDPRLDAGLEPPAYARRYPRLRAKEPS